MNVCVPSETNESGQSLPLIISFIKIFYNRVLMNAAWNNDSKKLPSALCMATKSGSSKARVLEMVDWNLQHVFEIV